MFQQRASSGRTGGVAYGQASNRSKKWPESPRCSPMSLLSDHDLYLFNEGSHIKLYEQLGAHVRTVNGAEGTNFAVWAPDAEQVFVMGGFNNWKKGSHPLYARGSSGI